MGTAAAVVAGIVAVMRTDSPAVSVVSSTAPAQDLFRQSLGGLLHALQKAFLPHLAAGIGLFMMTAYVTYAFGFAPAHLPKALEWGIAVVFLGMYGVFAFSYSLLTACVFALRAACLSWDAFIDGMLGLVKEKVAAKIDNMGDGLAKEQAKVVVAGSVSEVAGLFSKYEGKTWLHWLAAVLLGVLTFAMRSVLVARIVKISGATVNLGKLFAGRATLVGAIFLNLRLFATLLLWLLYALGIFIVLMNFLFVFWIK